MGPDSCNLTQCFPSLPMIYSNLGQLYSVCWTTGSSSSSSSSYFHFAGKHIWSSIDRLFTCSVFRGFRPRPCFYIHLFFRKSRPGFALPFLPSTFILPEGKELAGCWLPAPSYFILFIFVREGCTASGRCHLLSQRGERLEGCWPLAESLLRPSGFLFLSQRSAIIDDLCLAFRPVPSWTADSLRRRASTTGRITTTMRIATVVDYTLRRRGTASRAAAVAFPAALLLPLYSASAAQGEILAFHRARAAICAIATGIRKSRLGYVFVFALSEIELL
jgi:hypothetical protein